MKKLIFAILCIALVLSGCCIKHEWSGATCTEPSVCLKCGATGEGGLGHDWQADAGVLICSRCGAIDDSEERAALGLPERPAETPVQPEVVSTPEPAFTAQPETEKTPAAEKERAGFEKYGIVTNMAFSEVYPFTTATRDDPSLLTTGNIAVTAFGILPEDSTHAHRDGYQWRYVIMQATFYDSNAKKNGVKVMALCEDYYDIILCGSSQRLDQEGYTAFTVISNGQEAECRYKRTGKWSEWYNGSGGRREIIYSSLWEIQIPDGYDGVVVGLYSSAVDWQEGAYINEVYSSDDFKLFRIS